MRRRAWLKAAACAGAAPLGSRAEVGPKAEAWAPPPRVGEHAFELSIGADAAGVPVARGLLGQNVQWTDGGDDLLDRDGRWRAPIHDKALALRPTGLRFPGGAQSDTYRWMRGMGRPTDRGENLHFHRQQRQPTLMGTAEFLELCEACDAQPLITVNLVTGTTAEAAAWVKAVNRQGMVSPRSGRRLPRVSHWELGNEPYLQEGDKSLWLTPAEYATRASAFARAMRAVDPDIRLGLPLRTATFSGLPATPYPDFAAQALEGVTDIDFLALHNAYMPYLFDGTSNASTIYWAAMGASAAVERNLDETRALARRHRGGAPLPMAITEYNGYFTRGKGITDDLVAAPLTGLYIADLLCMLARHDDVPMAHHWSLSGNWKFGAIASGGFERPGYKVLALMDQALRGVRLPAELRTQRFEVPDAGAVRKLPAQSLVTALATREGTRVRAVLINKDRYRKANGRVRLAGEMRARFAEGVLLVADDPMEASDHSETLRRRALQPTAGDDGVLGVSLPPASVALLSWGR